MNIGTSRERDNTNPGPECLRVAVRAFGCIGGRGDRSVRASNDRERKDRVLYEGDLLGMR